MQHNMSTSTHFNNIVTGANNIHYYNYSYRPKLSPVGNLSYRFYGCYEDQLQYKPVQAKLIKLDEAEINYCISKSLVNGQGYISFKTKEDEALAKIILSDMF